MQQNPNRELGSMSTLGRSTTRGGAGPAGACQCQWLVPGLGSRVYPAGWEKVPFPPGINNSVGSYHRVAKVVTKFP